MIPQFPDFKVVEVDDRSEVESWTHKYPPYSDFNFTSLWAWDTSGERMISELNGNLVVRFTDYSTHEPFLSFLGTNETEHTARTLIDYSKANGMPPSLKLISEISIVDMRPSVISVAEDKDNFDYICSINELSALKGRKYDTKRKSSNKFRTQNPNAHTEIVELSNRDGQKEILSVISRWESNKIKNSKEYELKHEKDSIMRLFKTASSHNLIVTGVFVSDSMIAFSIVEILPNQYSISHFAKADYNYKGAFDFLTQKESKHLETLGISFINYEQDLGISSLRASKKAWRPVHFLKKYIIKMA